MFIDISKLKTICETIWLTFYQISIHIDKDKSLIIRHINDIFLILSIIFINQRGIKLVNAKY